MSDKKNISISPHLYSGVNCRKIMWNVVLALMPAVIASMYFFRLRALLLITVCVSCSVLTEFIFLKLRKKKADLSDGSAVVTGLLLALILPPSVPLTAAFLGAVVSIIIGKQVFGGLGNNIFNPALVGRAFLMAAFPVIMTRWINPFSLDAVTTATPLGLLKFSHTSVSLWPLFTGSVSGSLGETSALAIIAGGLYLIIKGYADWRIPFSMIFSAGFFSLILYFINPLNGSVLFHLLSGGFMFGAFFMATDPVTSPLTAKGKYIFGCGIGIIVILIRKWGGLPEGVMYSILLFNAVTPLINRISRPKRFGV